METKKNLLLRIAAISFLAGFLFDFTARAMDQEMLLIWCYVIALWFFAGSLLICVLTRYQRWFAVPYAFSAAMLAHAIVDNAINAYFG